MKHGLLILVAIVCAVGLSACSGRQSSSSATSPSPSSQSAATTVSPTVSSLPAASFTDITGYDGAQQINDLAALGIFNQTTGAFRPNDPIMRGEFVRWLVKANNAIVKDSQYHIRLAQSNAATFVDVPPKDPNFQYIQGLADSGYVIGVDASHFAPGKGLTREQMIYVKASLDEHHTIKTSADAGQRPKNFSDMSKIGYKYLGAAYEDESAGTTGNFRRVYGNTSDFKPQAQVTRGEAAIALSVMKGEWAISAAAALGRTPYP